MPDESQIKALYGELQGILSQTPVSEGSLYGEKSWAQYHETLSLLEKEMGEDLSRFRVDTYADYNMLCTDIIPFRQKVNALIMHIYYRYFPDKNPPFSGPPPSNINVSTNVSQNQAVYVQLIIDFAIAMDEKLRSLPDDSKEKRWWEKVKGSLGTITSLSQLIATLINTAQEYGLTIEQLKRLFT